MSLWEKGRRRAVNVGENGRAFQAMVGKINCSTVMVTMATIMNSISKRKMALLARDLLEISRGPGRCPYFSRSIISCDLSRFRASCHTPP
jgi:hypothetical protein